jgi:hypothetical protein
MRCQCACLEFELAILVFNALPISFAGLIRAGDRIQTHLRPSSNQKNIFYLAIVRRARYRLPSTGFERFLLDLGHIFIIRLLLIVRLLLTAEVKRIKGGAPGSLPRR